MIDWSKFKNFEREPEPVREYFGPVGIEEMHSNFREYIRLRRLFKFNEFGKPHVANSEKRIILEYLTRKINALEESWPVFPEVYQDYLKH
jgi:hypothetical protein